MPSRNETHDVAVAGKTLPSRRQFLVSSMAAAGSVGAGADRVSQ